MQLVKASHCLMNVHFTVCRENGVGWSQEIRDDVIGEAAKFGSVYHIHVDATSPEGCVYMKCQSPQVAAAVVNALNGRKYAGKSWWRDCRDSVGCSWDMVKVFGDMRGVVRT